MTSFNTEALVNKGLLLLEKDHSYEEAVGSFENALKGLTSYGVYSDKAIWNVIGVTKYLMHDYEAAIECFEKALELDNSFKLASHNKNITLETLTKK
jgi:tetratricopeptide (TPR) repeat protein